MKVKFNVIDGLIVLVLLAAIVAGVLLLGGGKTVSVSSEGEKKTIQFQVEFTEKEKDFTEIPKVGDVVFVGVKDKIQAKVVNVEVKPSETLGYDVVEGNVYRTTIPERFDMMITVEGEAVETKDDIKMKEMAVRVGEQMVLKSKNWTGVGYTMAIDVL